MTVIIDYGMGNLGSILNMIKKIGKQAVITSDPVEIDKADKIILPGVGRFDAGMRNLHEAGLIEVLNKKALVDKVPVLGICLGMQLLTKGSEEGNVAGLGWIDADTTRFSFDNSVSKLKVPHMGWNSIKQSNQSKLLNDFDFESVKFYFVHSYQVQCNDKRCSVARTTYGIEFDSIIQNDNVMGTQFHPEKSHKYGMKLLKNFMEW